jgi:hypothetical protein
VAEQIITDANSVNQLAQQLLKEPEKEIKTQAPIDNSVDLPGGFINREGALVKYAEVRELNGADEETIARAGTTGRALNVMLQRGLTSLGGEPTSSQDLDTLLSGDRDAILLGVRRATFGSEITFEGACPKCRVEQEIVINIDKDIPTKELDDPIQDRNWTYESKSGLVSITLPNGKVQRQLLENTDKTTAEMNTILLSGCIGSVNGSPSIGATTVLKLSWKDREELVKQILDRNPGPRLGEVKKSCEACGEVIPMPLTLTELFRV